MTTYSSWGDRTVLLDESFLFTFYTGMLDSTSYTPDLPGWNSSGYMEVLRKAGWNLDMRGPIYHCKRHCTRVVALSMVDPKT